MRSCQKYDSLKRRFTLPNELYSLGLTAEEQAVYAYLLFCENRKTHQCYPSYKTIGKAVGKSPNTVRKYVADLEDKRLISTENTSVITRNGVKRNGNLLYTIRPIQEAVNQYYERQFQKLEKITAQQNRHAAQEDAEAIV